MLNHQKPTETLTRQQFNQYGKDNKRKAELLQPELALSFHSVLLFLRL